MKSIIWMGASKEALQEFPEQARRWAGHQLHEVQCGRDPADWKPMSSIGAGVREIRISEASGAFRVLYLATQRDGIYVLHCFQKKTRKTSRRDLELARRRFKEMTKFAG